MQQYIVALYIRLSLEDYKTESLSIHSQRKLLRNYAETVSSTEKVEILEFIDNGYSGTNFERPAVQELLELVRGNKIDCIIVKDFSRFGRNSIETGYFIERVFPLFHTRFISVTDNFDTINYKEDTGGLDVAFKYLISETYSRDLSVKSKTAKYAKMRRGEYISKICPYGYKKGGNNHFDIDSEAASVVRQIFDLALHGSTVRQIAAKLYEQSILTPGEYKASKGTMGYDISRTHHIWQTTTIRRILSDERYTGIYIMGKSAVNEIGSNRVHLKDESQWFKIPNHHPAIIEPEDFENTQNCIASFKSVKRNKNMYPLRGKVFCGCCGHTLTRTKKDPEYSCRFSQGFTDFACHSLSIKESELETALYATISKQAEVVLGLDPTSTMQELQNRLAAQSQYEQLIKNCKNAKMHLYESLLLGEIAEYDYKKIKAEYDAELVHLSSLHNSAASQTELIRSDHKKQTDTLILAQNILSKQSLTRELVESLLNRVFVYSDYRIEIEWLTEDFTKYAEFKRA